MLMACLISFGAVSGSTDARPEQDAARLAAGALLFQQRCAICHGSDGLGEGPLSVLSLNHPSANLLTPRVALNADSIRRAIADGPLFADISVMMPPWRDELTAEQIDSLTRFVVLLRQDIDAALRLARKVAAQLEPSARLGRNIFIGRCALCHGRDGTGSGRLGQRLQPRASNLVDSHAPDAYLRTIIAQGGKAMGRSEKMPVWNMELNNTEIDSLVLYINALRSEK